MTSQHTIATTPNINTRDTHARRGPCGEELEACPESSTFSVAFTSSDIIVGSLRMEHCKLRVGDCDWQICAPPTLARATSPPAAKDHPRQHRHRTHVLADTAHGTQKEPRLPIIRKTRLSPLLIRSLWNLHIFAGGCCWLRRQRSWIRWWLCRPA